MSIWGATARSSSLAAASVGTLSSSVRPSARPTETRRPKHCRPTRSRFGPYPRFSMASGAQPRVLPTHPRTRAQMHTDNTGIPTHAQTHTPNTHLCSADLGMVWCHFSAKGAPALNILNSAQRVAVSARRQETFEVTILTRGCRSAMPACVRGDPFCAWVGEASCLPAVSCLSGTLCAEVGVAR